MANEMHPNDTMTIPEPRLIPQVVSNTARATPEKIWGALPRSDSDVSQGYEDITFARLNYAVTRACKWLLDNVEPHRRTKFEPLAYTGPPDSRYIILAIAAIKTGFQVWHPIILWLKTLRSGLIRNIQMLFLSPRNSDEAQQSIISEASCHKFLCSASMENRVKKLIQSRSKLSDISSYAVPEQRDLLRDEYVADYPYDRTLEQARYEPLVILHTSRSVQNR